MPTLLLRFEGPMQSWGTRSRFSDRDSESEPSKSGVIGVLAAAQGIKRGGDYGGLETARMGVRVDRPGVLSYDFQTTRNVLRSDEKDTANAISKRYYLSDASFLVGLQHPQQALLEKAWQALLNPVFATYLGRRSYVPSKSIYLADGLSDLELEAALRSYPFSKPPSHLILEETPPNGSLRMDQPIPNSDRNFAPRFVRYVPWSPPPALLGI